MSQINVNLPASLEIHADRVQQIISTLNTDNVQVKLISASGALLSSRQNASRKQIKQKFEKKTK